jgi:beta-lactamase superfamily II metal-dependent hydrolase
MRGSACTRAAALAAAVLLVPWTPAPRGLELLACDVGHGTAVVLRVPGGSVWVFDAGSRDRTGVGREALAPILAAWEATSIRVVASHPDRDHMQGLCWLLLRYPPAVWAGALPAPDPGRAERLPHTTLVMDVQAGVLELPLGAPLRASLLRAGPLPGNEGSRSLLLSPLEPGGPPERVLLCGDAEAEGLAGMLADLPQADGPGGLLLLPHHGSDTPWLAPLLERFRPREVWVSTTAEPAVAAELDRRGLEWRWTGRDGVLSWHGTR